MVISLSWPEKVLDLKERPLPDARVPLIHLVHLGPSIRECGQMWDEAFRSPSSLNPDSPIWIWKRVGEGIDKCVANEFAFGLLCLGQTSQLDESVTSLQEARRTSGRGRDSPPASRAALDSLGFMLPLKETHANQPSLPRKLHQIIFSISPWRSQILPSVEHVIWGLFVKGKQMISSYLEGARSFLQSRIFFMTTLWWCRHLRCLLNPQRNRCWEPGHFHALYIVTLLCFFEDRGTEHRERQLVSYEGHSVESMGTCMPVSKAEGFHFSTCKIGGWDHL